MTSEEWIEKYYPVPASEATGSELEAAEHSLQKWSGLRIVPSDVDELGEESKNSPIPIDSSTCALCQRHSTQSPGCGDCILVQIRGMSCFLEENHSPYSDFVIGGNPEPMIQLLQQAVDHLKKGKRKRQNATGRLKL